MTIDATIAEGRSHGFPLCCVLRYAIDHHRPRILSRLLPDVWPRVRGAYGFRQSLADGMVPCEFHATKFLLDGDRTWWRTGKPGGTCYGWKVCCETLADLMDSGAAKIEQVTVDPSEHAALGEVARMWVLTIDDEGISIHACPWCGVPL